MSLPTRKILQTQFMTLTLLMLNPLVMTNTVLEWQRAFKLNFKCELLVNTESFHFGKHMQKASRCVYECPLLLSPAQVKQSMLSSMFLRVLRICKHKVMDDEIRKSYEIRQT